MAIFTASLDGPPSETLTVSNAGASPVLAGAQPSITLSDVRAAHGTTSATAAADQYFWWASTASKILKRTYVWVSELTAVERPVLQIRHAGGLAAQVVINVAGFARLSTAGSGSTTVRATAPTTFPTAQWVRVELYADAGTSATTGAARAAIYAGDSLTPLWDSGAVAGVDVAGENAAFSTQRIQVLGGCWTDSVGMKTDADAVWGAWSAVTAPQVTVPASTNASASSTVEVAVSATGATSYAWTVLSAASSAAPTLTGASTASVSLTAPAAGNLVTLQCVVTGSAGLTTTVTSEVRVPLSTDSAPLPLNGTGVGTWTRAGGSATDGAALSDSSDATYVESPTLNGTQFTRRLRLAPMTSRSTLTLTQRLALSATGSATVKVRLFDGVTQRQEWTQAVTTTPTDYTFAVTSPGSISDWGNLSVEFSVV